jgi:hypothetical protein
MASKERKDKGVKGNMNAASSFTRRVRDHTSCRIIENVPFEFVALSCGYELYGPTEANQTGGGNGINFVVQNPKGVPSFGTGLASWRGYSGSYVFIFPPTPTGLRHLRHGTPQPRWG